jgi:hypothetical protein
MRTTNQNGRGNTFIFKNIRTQPDALCRLNNTGISVVSADGINSPNTSLARDAAWFNLSLMLSLLDRIFMTHTCKICEPLPKNYGAWVERYENLFHAALSRAQLSVVHSLPS